MHQSKVIALLRCLTPKEIRRFDAFLRSPYFEAPADVIAVWDVLLPHAPRFPDAALDRLRVATAAFPGRPLPTDNELSKLLNAFLLLAEQFIAVEDLRRVPADAECRVIAAYHRHGLAKNFDGSLRRAQRMLADMPHRDAQWLHLHYTLTSIAARDQVHNQARTPDEHLQRLTDALDAYYLGDRLRLACERVNRQHILSSDLSALLTPFDQQLLAVAEGSPVPTVQLYAQLLHLLTLGDDARHFTRLLDLMAAHRAVLSADELRELYSYAQNHCIRRVRLGEADFLRRLFDLYQRLIADGLLLEHQALSPWKYKNIASVGLQLGEYAWVEDFITRQQPFLPENFRASAYAYNLADLAYHRGDYPTALRALGQVEFSDVFYALGTRRIQLKIYYEQEATEPLLSLIQAFRVYLRRNKLVSAPTRLAYTHFLHIVQQLTRAREGGHTTSLLSLIATTQPLVDEAWLRKMATALME